ncbi:MAG: hypothetical protein GY719_31585 [bacterium]|nr:hypothetical protein [bacterium]
MSQRDLFDCGRSDFPGQLVAFDPVASARQVVQGGEQLDASIYARALPEETALALDCAASELGIARRRRNDGAWRALLDAQPSGRERQRQALAAVGVPAWRLAKVDQCLADLRAAWLAAEAAGRRMATWRARGGPGAPPLYEDGQLERYRR